MKCYLIFYKIILIILIMKNVIYKKVIFLHKKDFDTDGRYN